MAKIYESAGRRVQLTGPRSSRGFSPGTAVDRTSAVRQQSAQQISQLERAEAFRQRNFASVSEAVQRNYQRSSGLAQEYFERSGRNLLANNQAANQFEMEQTLTAWEQTNQQADRATRLGIQQQKETENLYLSQLSGVLESNARTRAANTAALTQFSKSLTDFVAAELKTKSEEEYKVGLSLALNGEIKVEDGQYRQFKQAESVLANSAAAEGQLNEAMSQVNLPLAEDQRTKSPILKGWRAYGAAVGLLKRSASQYQVVMDTFMGSREATVPLPDGRVIAPRDARGPAEIKAAMAVGQQMFIEATGLTGINPVLMVEHLTPTVLNVNNSILANMLAQGRKEDKENALFNLDNKIGVAWKTLTPENVEEIQSFFQDTVKGFMAEGIPRGEANDRFMDKIKVLGTVSENLDLIAALENTPINPSNPGMGTLGDRYKGEFQKIYSEVAAANERFDAEREEEQNELVARVLADYSALQSGAGTNQQALTQAFDQARQTLSQLAAQGNLKALESLNQLEMQGALYNPFAYAQIVQSMDRGQAPPTEEQLNQMVLQGTLQQEQANRIRAMKPDDKALNLAKGQDPVVRNAATAMIRENFQMTAVDVAEVQTILAPLVDTLSAEVSTQLRNQLSAFLARGQTPSPADVNGLIQSLMNGYRTDPRFSGKFDPTSGRLVPNKPLSRTPFVTQAVPQNATRPVRDFTQVAPYEIQNRRPNLRSSFVLTPEELTQNTQRFLNGQEPSARAQQLMSATGTSFENLLRNQSIAYNIPFTNLTQSQLAQSAAERRSLAPGAAAIINDPNVPAWRKTRAFREVNAARQRQEQARLRAQQRQQPTQPIQGLDPDIGSKVQALRPLMDLVGNAEGGAQQYDAINRGRAGDTPGGYPGLSNMTIKQVMDLQRQGYNATGRYQFIPGTLRETVRDAGLDPNTTKFSPEVQDQLFVTRLTRSRARARLGAFLRGESNDIGAALMDLSNEFAVVKNLTGGNPLSGVGGNSPSIEATHAAQMLRRAREAFRLSRRSSDAAVYVIDSLGYGSTGPHADIKPVRPGTNKTDRNLPAYRKGTLDSFVDLVLPDGQRGPLSRMSTTTDDDPAHRRRGSFGHDYAAPKGSKVMLKNGARVVGSFKGDEGTDHMIIELPDGRRFQFLHGTQPR